MTLCSGIATVYWGCTGCQICRIPDAGFRFPDSGAGFRTLYTLQIQNTNTKWQLASKTNNLNKFGTMLLLTKLYKTLQESSQI